MSGLAAWLSGALALVCAVAAVLGVALARSRKQHRSAIEERGWLLEKERESAASAAVDAERVRIAAELHDIVSHNVSLMVVQANAAREVLATMPDAAAQAMAAVEKAGRDTMTELRDLLGLLAPSPNGDDEPYGAELSPQPSLKHLGRLVDRIAFAGLPVEVRVSGTARPLPAGIDVTAYRIVQEALTNALKHGDRAKAEVSVRYADHSLRVEVLNSGPSVLRGETPTGPGTARTGPGATPAGPGTAAEPAPHADGTGRGLLGLRERVAVYGGDLDARRRLGGGYRVRARIPLDRPGTPRTDQL